MKRLWLCLLFLPAFFTACKTPPAAEQSPQEDSPDVIILDHEPSPDAITVDQAVYDSTLADVRLFVDNLNQLIGNKNYNGWKDSLSDAFFARISSPEFLANASETPVLKKNKIVLKSSNDYFLNVVVPSRSNSKVDAIEFISADQVKVIYFSNVRNNETREIETRRLRLYELVKSEDTWKIID